jgi:hypothetical protein
MTEHDLSPEAYEHHLSTQSCIACWIDNTGKHANDFELPFDELTLRSDYLSDYHYSDNDNSSSR